MNGFEVFNDQGFKIAGSDFPNLVLYSKVTLTTTKWNVAGPGFDLPSHIGSAVIPNDGATLRFYRSINSGYLVEQGGRIFSGQAGDMFECYSFGPVVADPAPGGVEIYAPDGRLTFSTSRPFLRLAGVFVDPTPTFVPDLPGIYPYSVQTAFAEGERQFAYQFSNAHYHYRLVRPSGRSYNASYNSVRVAQLTPGGLFMCMYVNKYLWTHSWAPARVREVPNKSAPQRLLIADVTGL